MWDQKLKTITFVIIMVFSFSCTKSIIYLAPQEEEKINSSQKIIVIMKDGQEIELIDPHIEEEKIIGLTRNGKDKTIDFTLIQSLKIEKKDSYYAILFSGVAIVAGILVGGAATAPEPPPSESCPFIYSFNGDSFIFDAEPYGAAICQSLKRAEWCGLEHMREIKGQYKLMIANELDETQYTDEVSLLVVDHPKGTVVAPDASGRIHSLSQLYAPKQAIVGKGKDINPLLSNRDGIFWQTCVDNKHPDRKEDLRDEIILEFPKPTGAKKVKLFVNACTSLWGSQVAKQFLELHGSQIDQWYDDVNNFGPAYQQIMNWFFNEELYLLRIWVETKNGWKNRGMIYGGGPFISEDKVYLIDIKDVEGDTLKIKLMPPATFWIIDSIEVDYTENQNLKIHELSVLNAFDKKGLDVREKLIALDDNYLIMPNKGDQVEVTYMAPPKEEGWERSIILKAVGYYDIHLQKDSQPQYDVLEKFHSEPGFTIKFALKEYLKARKNILTKR